jgi:hypothetical protein
MKHNGISSIKTIVKERERIDKRSGPTLKYYPGVGVEVLKKPRVTTATGRDSNRGPSKRKPEAIEPI